MKHDFMVLSSSHIPNCLSLQLFFLTSFVTSPHFHQVCQTQRLMPLSAVAHPLTIRAVQEEIEREGGRGVFVCVCVCVCVCIYACVNACVHACVRE